MASRRRLDVFNHHERSHKQNLEHTAQLTSLNNAHTQDGVGGGSKLGVMTDSIASSNNTISSQSVLTASRLNNIQNAITQDGVGGGNKLGVMTDAINTNIISSLSKLDTIATNTANIHIDVESVNLNVDTLEAKTEAISNGQTQNGDGTGNKPGVMLDAINTNTISGNSKLDTIITNTASSSSTGLATEATLAAAEVHLGSIDTSATAMDIGIGGLRSDLTQNGLGGGNKPGVMLEAQNTNIIALKNSLTGDGAGGDNKPGVMLKAINDNIINTNTVALSGVDGTLQGIDTLLGDTQTIHSATNTKLDTLITSNAAIKTAVEILDNVVSGSEAQVDVVSLPALPTGTNTIGTVNLSATDNAVLDAIATDAAAIEVLLTAANTDHAANEALLTTIDADTNDIKTNTAACATDLAAIEVLLTAANTDHAANEVLLTTIDADTNDIKTNTAACATDLAALEVLQTATNSKLDTLDAVQDNALTKLTNIETAVQLIDDVVKAEDAAHSGADKGIMGLSVRKDTATNLAGSDADYQPLITGSAGHLHINDSLHHRVKDVAFMTTESISANSFSSTNLDTEGYSVVNLYGECTGGTTTSGSTELRVMGSNASSGTYYSLGGLQASNFISGRSMVNSTPANVGDAVGNNQRYLKIFNDTAGTIELTLRAVMSGFNTYI